MLSGGTMTVQDGDAAFAGVDARRPPQQLEPGLVSAAKNIRFEYGAAWPRHGVAEQGWGRTGAFTLGNYVAGPFESLVVTVTGFTAGKVYDYEPGNSVALGAEIDGSSTVLTVAGSFTATQDTYYVISNDSFAAEGDPCTARVGITLGQVRAFARYQDNDGNDCGVLITDGYRGEDGGRGRAWRIFPGTLPVEIPLNGHDIWGECRLVPTFNGLILLRRDDARHYFNQAAVNTTTDTITLNTEPAFETGERVIFQADTSDLEENYLLDLISNTGYYASVDGDEVQLYDTPANAIAGGAAGLMPLTQTSTLGRYYLQRAAAVPGPFGNTAPPLLMQGTLTQSPFAVGFDDVDADVSAAAAGSGEPVINVENHRLVTGDAVAVEGNLAGSDGLDVAGGFARVLSEGKISVHPTVEDALLDTNAIDADTGGTTGVIRRAGASRLPMPGGREGLYFLQRNFIVNGRNNVLISDPLDPLHFTPMVAAINASLGESDAVMALMPLGNDTLLVLKENSVLALTGLSGERTEWRLQEITREFGCVAPLTARNVGSDVWFLSRRGVVSIERTVAGERWGVAQPVSDPIQRYLDRVDWVHASKAVAEVWGNLYVLAVPERGQEEAVNNLVLPYSFLNQQWAGEWCGDTLRPAAWARLPVFGEERLCFVDTSGAVRWMGDDYLDGDSEIETELVSRGYLCGVPERKIFLAGELNVDTWNARVTVEIRTPGVGESETTINARTYSRTQYLVHGKADYDPENTNDDFHTPRRGDYSATIDDTGIHLGDDGITPDTHQNLTLRFRCRSTDRYAQLVVTNDQGSCRLNSLRVAGRTKALTAREAT